MTARALVRTADIDRVVASVLKRGGAVGRIDVRPDGSFSVIALGDLTANPKGAPDVDPENEWDQRLGAG